MQLVKPIKLGKLQLPSNLVQGPLAGYSCAPFRVLTERYGAPGFCTTEMISAKDLIHRKQKPKRYLGKDEREGLLCYQLSANDPTILGQACELVSQHGADLIDLNCGCPVNKIRSKNTGSKLLASPDLIHQLVVAMRQNSDAVISIKIRIAGDIRDHDDLAVIDAAQAAGVDYITVHGRHWTQRYDVASDNAAIANIVNYASVPVFANGDVEDLASMQKVFQETKAAGIMIARAGVGQPWLCRELALQDIGNKFNKPSNQEIAEIFLEHIKMLIELDSEKLAVLQSRKLAKYYARTFANKHEFVTKMQQACSFKEVQNIINDKSTIKPNNQLNCS